MRRCCLKTLCSCWVRPRWPVPVHAVHKRTRRPAARMRSPWPLSAAAPMRWISPSLTASSAPRRQPPASPARPQTALQIVAQRGRAVAVLTPRWLPVSAVRASEPHGAILHGCGRLSTSLVRPWGRRLGKDGVVAGACPGCQKERCASLRWPRGRVRAHRAFGESESLDVSAEALGGRPGPARSLTTQKLEHRRPMLRVPRCSPRGRLYGRPNSSRADRVGTSEIGFAAKTVAGGAKHRPKQRAPSAHAGEDIRLSKPLAGN